jgi:hypothetical protein
VATPLEILGVSGAILKAILKVIPRAMLVEDFKTRSSFTFLRVKLNVLKQDKQACNLKALN